MSVGIAVEESSDIHPLVEALDLEPVAERLAQEMGLARSASAVVTAEREYRRFLTMKKRFPDRSFSPNKKADRFWHWHILHTAKYAMDCRRSFGFYLHHSPGEVSVATQRSSGDTYRLLFGESIQDSSTCDAGDPSGPIRLHEGDRPDQMRPQDLRE